MSDEATKASAIKAGARTSHEGQSQRLTGVQMIAAERQRQIVEECWTAEHDSWHSDGELALAGACYAMADKERALCITQKVEANSVNHTSLFALLWPFAEEWWNPSPHDRVRELVKAGALIAAEIDRLKAIESQSDGAAELRSHAGDAVAEKSYAEQFDSIGGCECPGCVEAMNFAGVREAVAVSERLCSCTECDARYTTGVEAAEQLRRFCADCMAKRDRESERSRDPDVAAAGDPADGLKMIGVGALAKRMADVLARIERLMRNRAENGNAYETAALGCVLIEELLEELEPEEWKLVRRLGGVWFGRRRPQFGRGRRDQESERAVNPDPECCVISETEYGTAMSAKDFSVTELRR